MTTNRLTLIAVHRKRSVEAMTDIGVIGGYAGMVVHYGFADVGQTCKQPTTTMKTYSACFDNS